MKPVVEIVSFTRTDDQLANNSLTSTMFECISKFEGFVNGFRGYSVENLSEGYYVLIWDSFSSHEAARKTEEFFTFRESLKFSGEDNVVTRRIDFGGDPTVALSAPVTEYTITKPKDGNTQADVDEVIDLLKEAAAVVPGVYSPLASGPVKDSEELYALVAGWESIEAHMNALKGPPLDILVPRLFETAEVTLVHLVLQPLD